MGMTNNNYQKNIITDYIQINFIFKSLFSFPNRIIKDDDDKTHFSVKNKIYSKELVLFLSLLDTLTHFNLEPFKKESSKEAKEFHKLYNHFFLSTTNNNIKIKQTFLKKKKKI